MIKQEIRNNFIEARQVLDNFMDNQQNWQAIEKAGNILIDAFRAGKKVLSCGNGGSMSDAMHFAEELTGKFRNERQALPAMAISDPAYLTCTANDYGFDSVFSRYVEAFGLKGDVLLAISTSGNSPNILKAARIAREKNMHIIALTGKDGGQLASECDVEIRVPHFGYSDRIQEIHIKVIHSLIHFVELEMV
ncbi:MAG: D-sedoheptulose 7-phosphate isomerase [Bacteroidales bacterium]|nr:D-sedoheptulose 7-phosphate isomerase [Bacteroidales bacterium]MCF8454819.1 D-sedoheptulose 7-phosphate isomerase [Bacteroidales bacterium]